MSRLDNKIAIITGSAQGIGRQIALAMARAGADVVAVDLVAERCSEVVNEIQGLGREALGVGCDITDEDQVKALIHEVLEKYGQIHILVNNAGWQFVASVEESTLSQWEKTMAVNLRGPFLCSRAVIPLMREQGKGIIINITSRAGRVPKALAAAYGASKFGLNGFSQCLALEVAQYGIRVIALAPPRTNTPLAREIVQFLEPSANTNSWSDGSEFGAFVAWSASEEAAMLDGQIVETGGLRP
jgi:NAD(P)-dependent dehydrogenase (short-subunit alcohol dehydrogenase family)